MPIGLKPDSQRFNQARRRRRAFIASASLVGVLCLFSVIVSFLLLEPLDDTDAAAAPFVPEARLGEDSKQATAGRQRVNREWVSLLDALGPDLRHQFTLLRNEQDAFAELHPDSFFDDHIEWTKAPSASIAWLAAVQRETFKAEKVSFSDDSDPGDWSDHDSLDSDDEEAIGDIEQPADSEESNLEPSNDDPNDVDASSNDDDDDEVFESASQPVRGSRLRLIDDVDTLSDAAGLRVDLMIELLADKLVNGNLGIGSEEFQRIVRPKQLSLPTPKWKGDDDYLFSNGLPTCFGRPCNRSQYIIMKQNLSELARPQFISTYWRGVDLSRLTYAPENSLIARCRRVLCPQANDCDSPRKLIPSGVTPTRTKRISQILNHFKSLSSTTHCISAKEPHSSDSNSPFLTNFTPVYDAPIGGKIKRARFVGNDVCTVFNNSKNDVLHYIGVHQCAKSRQMIVPLPKAAKHIEDKPKHRDSKKQKKMKKPPKKPALTVPTMIVRYIKIDKIRYHQFHNPVIVALKNSFITRDGIIYNDEISLQPDSFCSGEYVSDFAAKSSLTSGGHFEEVFAASAPADPYGSVPYWLIMETLPRIASHFEELKSNPQILIHFNSRGGGKEFLSKFLRFLGMSGSVESRLISGDISSSVVYAPEPSLSCQLAAEWQLHQLRNLIASRLQQDSMQQRSWKEILVVKCSTQRARIDNHDDLVRMLAQEFRGMHVRVVAAGAEQASLRETLASFHAARIVVTPEGCALGYLVATQFDASVIEVLAQPRADDRRAPWDLTYSALARYLGITWFGVVLPPHSRAVDLVEMHGLVAAILAGVK
ncbi:hypothetical protein HDU82_003446 [Entophlyctis luteolus]|nr:hypothetical protein HDU82_003446 [Entophlyctis luteolus]